MNDNLLTVKEVAELVNVSPQSIYQKLNNQLKKYVVKDGNIKRLKSIVLSEYYNITVFDNLKILEKDNQVFSSKINDVLNNNQVETSDLNNTNESKLNNNQENSSILNDNLIIFFKEQITQKDVIIKEKDLYIKELTEKITDLTERLAILFENAQQLQQTQQLLEAKNIVDDTEEKEPKQSFFQRLFKRK